MGFVKLTVLAARTSIGKTSIALHMALQAAKLLKKQEYVCFFSFEIILSVVDKQELVGRRRPYSKTE